MINKNYHYKQNSFNNQNNYPPQIKPKTENSNKFIKPNIINNTKNLPGILYDNKNYNSNIQILPNNINNLNNIFIGNKGTVEDRKIREPLMNEMNFLRAPNKSNSHNNLSNNSHILSNGILEMPNQTPNFNVTKNKFLMNFNPPNSINPQERVIAFGQDKSENNFKKTLRKPAVSNLIQNSSLNILNQNPITNSSFSNSFRGNNNIPNLNYNPTENGLYNYKPINAKITNFPKPAYDDELSYGAGNQNLNYSSLPNPNYSKNQNQNQILSESNHSNSTTNSYSNSKESNCPSIYVKEASCVREYAYKEDPNYKYRAAMEDMVKLIDKYMNNSDVGLFALFDGHGGGDIAQYLKNRLPELYSKILSPINNKFESDDYNYDIEGSINILFNKLDDEIKLTSESEYMGSTAVMVLICKEKDHMSPLTSRKVAYCANVGDSRCVLVSNYGVKRLSYDHKASDVQEINRVNHSGGMIFNGRVFGQLIITRAFGDHSLKRYGVIASPHITKHFINDKDKYLVLASDGVWDVIMDEELFKLSQSVGNADDFSKVIIKTSLLRGTQDNVSCIVLKL